MFASNYIRFLKIIVLITGAVIFVLPAPGPAFGGTDCDLAKIYHAKGFEKAKYWQKAIQLCPGYIRPYELLGNHYRKKDENEKAIELFTKAAELGSRNHKLYYLLATLFYQQGDLDLALRHVQHSLDLKAGYAKSRDLKTKIENSNDTRGPTIEIIEPAKRRALKIVYNSENMTVRGIVTDQNKIIWVKINQLKATLDPDGNFIRDIPVVVGSNTINVEAADSLGNRSSATVQIERLRPPPKTKKQKRDKPEPEYRPFEKSYAVVIGINNYVKWPALEFAVADAEAVKARLKDSGFDHVVVILDREATQSRILTELFHELPKKVTNQDRLFFYFAGHGQTESLPQGGKRGYIIPADGDVTNFADTAISMQQIRNLSRRISAKHILYVMDSCYSGLGLNRSGRLSSKLNGYLRKVASMRVVQIITAGGAGEQVQERDGHGLFTTYFLKALNGSADINKDNVVTGTELGAYLRPTVSEASQLAQTPLYGRLEGEGEFLFPITP